MPDEIVEEVYTTRGGESLSRLIREKIDEMWLKGFVMAKYEVEDNKPGRVATLTFIPDHDEDEDDE